MIESYTSGPLKQVRLDGRGWPKQASCGVVSYAVAVKGRFWSIGSPMPRASGQSLAVNPVLVSGWTLTRVAGCRSVLNYHGNGNSVGMDPPDWRLVDGLLHGRRYIGGLRERCYREVVYATSVTLTWLVVLSDAYRSLIMSQSKWPCTGWLSSVEHDCHWLLSINFQFPFLEPVHCYVYLLWSWMAVLEGLRLVVVNRVS